jgi:hypothetical protein
MIQIIGLNVREAYCRKRGAECSRKFGVNSCTSWKYVLMMMILQYKATGLLTSVWRKDYK